METALERRNHAFSPPAPRRHSFHGGHLSLYLYPSRARQFTLDWHLEYESDAPRPQRYFHHGLQRPDCAVDYPYYYRRKQAASSSGQYLRNLAPDHWAGGRGRSTPG